MPIFNSTAAHGKTDSGAVYNGRLEKNETLKLSLAFSAEMRRRGHTIKEFRTDDSVNCDWKSSRAFIDTNSANISLVWHLNAFKPEGATGTEIWSHNNDIPSTDFAAKLSKIIADTLSVPNRGRKANGAAWISPNNPCVSIEVCFIDQTSDMQKYDANFSRLITAVCDFCEMYCGKAEQPAPTAPVPQPSEMDALRAELNGLKSQLEAVNAENVSLAERNAVLESALSHIKNRLSGI